MTESQMNEIERLVGSTWARATFRGLIVATSSAMLLASGDSFGWDEQPRSTAASVQITVAAPFAIPADNSTVPSRPELAPISVELPPISEELPPISEERAPVSQEPAPSSKPFGSSQNLAPVVRVNKPANPLPPLPRLSPVPPAEVIKLAPVVRVPTAQTPPARRTSGPDTSNETVARPVTGSDPWSTYKHNKPVDRELPQVIKLAPVVRVAAKNPWQPAQLAGTKPATATAKLTAGVSPVSTKPVQPELEVPEPKRERFASEPTYTKITDESTAEPQLDSVAEQLLPAPQPVELPVLDGPVSVAKQEMDQTSSEAAAVAAAPAELATKQEFSEVDVVSPETHRDPIPESDHKLLEHVVVAPPRPLAPVIKRTTESSPIISRQNVPIISERNNAVRKEQSVVAKPVIAKPIAPVTARKALPGIPTQNASQRNWQPAPTKTLVAATSAQKAPAPIDVSKAFSVPAPAPVPEMKSIAKSEIDRTNSRSSQLEVDATQRISLSKNILSVESNDQSVCEVLQINSREVIVIGKSTGTATIRLSFENGTPDQVHDFRVDRPANRNVPSEEMVAQLQIVLDHKFPGRNIDLQFDRGSLVVQGTVTDSREAVQVLAFVREMYLVPVTDKLDVPRGKPNHNR